MKKLLTALCLCLAAGTAFAQGPVQTLTSAAYANMKKDEVYVIAFSAAYCGPCRAAKKTMLPALADKYAGDAKVHVFVVDVENDTGTPSLVKRFATNVVPVFVVLYNDTDYVNVEGFPQAGRETLQKQIETAVDKLK